MLVVIGSEAYQYIELLTRQDAALPRPGSIVWIGKDKPGWAWACIDPNPGRDWGIDGLADTLRQSTWLRHAPAEATAFLVSFGTEPLQIMDCLASFPWLLPAKACALPVFTCSWEVHSRHNRMEPNFARLGLRALPPIILVDDKYRINVPPLPAALLDAAVQSGSDEMCGPVEPKLPLALGIGQFAGEALRSLPCARAQRTWIHDDDEHNSLLANGLYAANRSVLLAVDTAADLSLDKTAVLRHLAACRVWPFLVMPDPAYGQDGFRNAAGWIKALEATSVAPPVFISGGDKGSLKERRRLARQRLHKALRHWLINSEA